jgi:hypothetical protein
MIQRRRRVIVSAEEIAKPLRDINNCWIHEIFLAKGVEMSRRRVVLLKGTDVG